MAQMTHSGWRLLVAVLVLERVAPVVCRLRGHQQQAVAVPGYESVVYCRRCRRVPL